MDSNNRNGGNNGGNKKNNRNLRSVLSLIGWALVLTLVFNYILAMTSGGKSFEITYSQMMNLVEEDQIKKIELKDGVLYATPVDGYTYTQESSSKNQQPRTYTQSEKNPITLYTTYLTDTRLLPLLDEHGVEYSSPVKSSWSVLGDILVMYILPMLLTMGLIVLVMRIVSKNGGGIGGIGNVGKSNAKVYMEKQTGVTFKDVAGQDEAKESLEEIIDFLHNPGKYTAIGAKLPKGALLVGSPGTGKTLLAQKIIERRSYSCLSVDLLKMGLIRSGNTLLTPEDDDGLEILLWPIVREVMKTAIENGQHLIVEGGYIPRNWKDDLSDDYLKEIRAFCLVMSRKYIENHFADIRQHACAIEQRRDDGWCTRDFLLAENARYDTICNNNAFQRILIDTTYDINQLQAVVCRDESVSPFSKLKRSKITMNRKSYLDS